jgi:phospholipase/carboxylesterase
MRLISKKKKSKGSENSSRRDQFSGGSPPTDRRRSALDRRSGSDRRKAYKLGHFIEGAEERRSGFEKRAGRDRREGSRHGSGLKDRLLDCIEILPEAEPQATVIWLHGLGADGHDFEPIVPELRLPASPPIRFLFPHAPERPVTINAGMVMRAWYDILELGDPTAVNMEDLLESADQLSALIENVTKRGIQTDRIVLAGFSQGGTIALHTGLRYERKLAGLMGLSTYLPDLDALPHERSEVNLQIPVMMAHGSMDPMIPIAKGIRTKQELTRLGYGVEWHQYPMMHQVCPDEISDIRAWLLKVLRGTERP